MWTLAYLDAGSGSMIASVVAGGAAGAAVVAKLVGRRMRDAVTFTKHRGPDEDAPGDGTDTGAPVDEGRPGA
jgi:hypothetical protein